MNTRTGREEWRQEEKKETNEMKTEEKTGLRRGDGRETNRDQAKNLNVKRRLNKKRKTVSEENRKGKMRQEEKIP